MTHHTKRRNEYGLALQEMNVEAFAKAQLNGKGVTIGVIDAGFYGAKTNNYLQHLFANERIKGVKDMLNPQRTKHFETQETSSDDHGTEVLEMITGYQDGKTQYGFATESDFYLARTDHGDREFRAEEDYWVTCLEWLDSLGVRLVNTSLGYATGFDNPEEDYRPEQMDGNTSVVSKAANIAAQQKGMILIVSAGNEGSDSAWRIVSAPADSQGVLAVGALTSSCLKAFYSSIGAENMPYLKPDVACIAQAGSGTSFTAPVVTGFAACLLQQNPTLKNTELYNIIRNASTFAAFPNNYVGYGTPQADIALQLLQDDKARFATVKTIKATGKAYQLRLPQAQGKALIFTKKSKTIVHDQSVVFYRKKTLNLKRAKNVRYTTVLADKTLYEIAWE